MESGDRVKVTVCANGAANDEINLDDLMAKRDPLDPRLLTIARIIARQAVQEYLGSAANDNVPIGHGGEKPE